MLGGIKPNLPIKAPNPATVFNVIGSMFGSVPSYTGPFTESKHRGLTTDRMRYDHEAGAWRFTDPALGEDFTFTQDKRGNLLLSDGRVIPYGFGSTGSRDRQWPSGDIRWNIMEEEAKLQAGGGADTDFSQFYRGDSRYTGGKSLPWQHYAMKTGPFYNPVKPQQASPPQPQQQQTTPVVPPLETPPAVPQLPAPPTLPPATVAPPQQTQTPPPSRQLSPLPPRPQPTTPMGFGNMFAGGLLGNAARNTYR